MLFSKKPYDFVAIVDVLTEAFIKLNDASTNCKHDQIAWWTFCRWGGNGPCSSGESIPAANFR